MGEEPLLMLNFIARGLAAAGRAAAVAGRQVAKSIPSGTKRAAGATLRGAGRAAGIGLQGTALAARGIYGGGKRAVSLGSNLWAVDASLSAIEERIKSSLPSFEHFIEVNVAGGPDATMRSIWNLAVATALGRYRAAVPAPTGITLMGTWDYSNKQVGIRLAYQNAGVLSYIVDQDPNGRQSALNYIIKGPLEETIGGRWQDFNAAKFGVRVGAIVGGADFNTPAIGMGGQPGAKVANPEAGVPEDLAKVPPNLDDAYRLITTRAKGDYRVQPPRPATESFLIDLVSNALTTPCTLPARPLIQDYGSPVKIYAAPGNTRLKGSIASTTDVNDLL